MPRSFRCSGAAWSHFVARAPKLLGRPYWGAYDNVAGQKSLVLLRAMHNKTNNQLVGNLFLGFRPTHFSAIFEDVNLGTGTALFVVDAIAGAVVISAPDRNSSTPSGDADPQLLIEGPAAQHAARHQRSGFFPVRQRRAVPQVPGGLCADPRHQLVRGQHHPGRQADHRSARGAREEHADRLGLCFVLSIVLALMLARCISPPLEALIESMRQTETGNYAQRMTPEGTDELTVLAHQFNKMASKIERHNVQLEERVMRTHARPGRGERQAGGAEPDRRPDRHRQPAPLRQRPRVEVNRAGRAGNPLALLMIDVDFFKNYNDHYGHWPATTACARSRRCCKPMRGAPATWPPATAARSSRCSPPKPARTSLTRWPNRSAAPSKRCRSRTRPRRSAA